MPNPNQDQQPETTFGERKAAAEAAAVKKAAQTTPDPKVVRPPADKASNGIPEYPGRWEECVPGKQYRLPSGALIQHN